MGIETTYKGRRIFLTGHTGFKGAWLAWQLIELGATVTGYSLAPEDGRKSLFQLSDLAKEMSSLEGDIRDFTSLDAALRKAKPDFVFHLAAEAIVRRAFDAPMQTFATNALGTVHVLESLRGGVGIKAAVLATTDKVYENAGEGRPFTEEDRLGGREPYGASKAMAELAAHAYRKSYFEKSGLAVATARAGNVIGGGDFAMDRIIPDLVEAASAGQQAVLRRPRAVRPWQHVLDCLKGYLDLGVHLAEGRASHAAYNFAPSDEGKVLDVEQLAERFLKELGRGSYRVEADAQGPWEAPALRLHAARAGADLKWTPVFDAPGAVDFSAQWYGRWLNGEAPRDLVLEQIRAFATLTEKV